MKINKLKEGVHVLFRVVELKDTYSILQEESTGIQIPYKVLDISLYSSILMYIRNIDCDNRLDLEYSILNDYNEDEIHSFNVIQEKEKGFVIEGKQSSCHFIPKSFISGVVKGKIQLKVKNIDRENNKLFFYSPDNQSNSVVVEDLFKVKSKYRFEVLRFERLENNFLVLKIKYNDFVTTVKAYDFQEYDTPSEVVCFVYDIKDNRVILNQDKGFLLKSLYNEGQSYKFKVIQRIEDLEKGNYFQIIDKYGLEHKVFETYVLKSNLDVGDFIGTEQSLFVNFIDDRGFLQLQVISRTDRTFYSADKIFCEIGKDHLKDVYFSNLVLVSSKEIMDEYSENEFLIKAKSDYKKKENLWFFSYLQFLKDYTLLLVKQELFDDSLKVMNLYNLLEEWMLDGSDFLSNFSPDKSSQIIEKAESQIEKTNTRIKAVKLIRDQKSESFIQNVLMKIKRSNHLRSSNLKLLKELLILSGDLLEQKTGEIIEIIAMLFQNNLLDQYDKMTFNSLLERRNKVERFELNQHLASNNNEISPENSDKILNIVRIQILQIIIAVEDDYCILISAALLRFISYLSKDVEDKRCFLKKAVECITTGSYLDLSLEDLDKVHFNDFLYTKLKVCDSKSECNKLIVRDNGAVFQMNKQWNIMSCVIDSYCNQHFEVKHYTITSFFDNHLKIVCPNNFLQKKTEGYHLICDYVEQMQSIFNGEMLKSINIKANVKSKPCVGDNVKVVVKNFLKDNTNAVFLRILDNLHAGEGILHINEFSKYHIEGMNGILKKGDVFNAQVIDVSCRGISFSVKDIIWDVVKTKLGVGDDLIGKVCCIVNGVAIIVSKEGYCCSSYDSSLMEGCSYKFRICDKSDKYQSFIVESLEKCNYNFNEKNSLSEFVKKEIVEDNINNSHKNGVHLVKELIWVVESYVNIENDIYKRVEFLFLLKLLNSLIKSAKSYFFEEHIKFLVAIEKFFLLKNDEKLNDYNPFDEKTVANFNSLNSLSKIYDILYLFNNKEEKDNLVLLSQTETDVKIKTFSELVLSYNILASYCNNNEILSLHKKVLVQYIKNEQISGFNKILDVENENIIENNNESCELITNLGRESKKREFKTSFIYAAGDIVINLEKQSFVILKTIAGFLNGDGGSLFIGVDDSGDISGLSSDYHYFQKNGNSDFYERFIRKYIVKYFNKDVNSQLDFVFRSSGTLEYLEIIIPEYESAVALNDEFYQRQGNETRVLKGNDLILFFQRKLNFKTRAIRDLTSNNNDLFDVSEFKEIDDKDNSCNNVEKIDFYEDQRKENTDNVVHKEKFETKPLAYLFFFDDSSYLISRDRKIVRKYKYIFPILPQHKKGYLIQAYDNGCINKIAIRTLLDKSYGTIYKNGFSQVGNLIKLKILAEDSLIILKTTKDNESYIKIYETGSISVHRFLDLKGNCIIQDRFDCIEKISFIDIKNISLFPKLLFKSRSSIGKKISNPYYGDELGLLESLCSGNN